MLSFFPLLMIKTLDHHSKLYTIYYTLQQQTEGERTFTFPDAHMKSRQQQYQPVTIEIENRT